MSEVNKILQKYGAQLIFGSSLLVGTAALFYSDYNSPRKKFNRQSLYDKKEAKEKSEKLVINFFISLLIENLNTTLEECILRFENAEPNITLQQFAQNKQRTAKMYIETYQDYYNTAKNKLKNGTTTYNEN